jgi:hypothetical protein
VYLDLPAERRDEITAARSKLTQAAALDAWGGFTLTLTALLWPAALVAAILVSPTRATTRT